MTLTFPLATKFGAGPTLNREFTSYLLTKGQKRESSWVSGARGVLSSRFLPAI